MSREDCAPFELAWEPGFVAEAEDPLATYKQKRDFDETSEPEGEVGEANKHRFVIQRHKAKRAGEHFDVRLENDDGALSSWAIPKHRMPEGKDRLLAIKTEDHPLSYMKFKGDIPEGEYGAGVMGIHDSGTYEEIEKTDSKLVFRLKGKKEKGTYALSRTDGKKWLLTEHSSDKEASAVPPLSKRAKSSYVKKRKEDSGNITYVYTKKHVEKRNKDKMAKLKKLNKSMSKLRSEIRKDLKSSDEREKYTALAVAIVDETYSRVGNTESAKDMKHYGLTTWLVKHVSFSGGNATIKYVGKAGVSQTKKVSEKPVVRLLKELCKGKKKSDRLFEGEDYSISAKYINSYLSPFGVSAKDIRGLHANEEMRKALKQVRKGKLPEPGKERDKKLKEEFKKALEIASEFVGHEPGTLKSRYLIPTLEPDYMKDGRIGTLCDDGVFASSPLSIRVVLPLSIRKLAGAWEDLQDRLKAKPLAIRPEWEILGIPGPFEKMKDKSDKDPVDAPESTSWEEEPHADQLKQKQEKHADPMDVLRELTDKWSTYKKVVGISSSNDGFTKQISFSLNGEIQSAFLSITRFKPNMAKRHPENERGVSLMVSLSEDNDIWKARAKSYGRVTTNSVAGSWSFFGYMPSDFDFVRDVIEHINTLSDGADQAARDDKLPGGLADEKDESDFDPKALAKGVKSELEHTDDPQLAKEIAMDHLVEDPDYYDKLEKMEEQSAMDMLPIHADPTMWSSEQLVEVISNPQLRTMLEEKDLLAAVVREMKKRDLKPRFEPKDIGEWREKGWFYIVWGEIPMGFVNNKSVAELIKSRLVRDFAKDGTIPEGQKAHFGHTSVAYWAMRKLDMFDFEDGELTQESQKKHQKLWPRAKAHAKPEADALLHHPLRNGKRKEFAERYITTHKAPDGFEPSKESVVTGGLPTDKTSRHAWADSEEPEFKRQFDDAIGPMKPGGSGDVEDEFVQDAASVVSKRLKAEEEGQDPEKLVDDVRIASFPLSCRRAINNLASGSGPSRTEVQSYGNG